MARRDRRGRRGRRSRQLRVPRIVLSVDNTLWQRLGVSRFTYQRSIRRAGGQPRVLRFDLHRWDPDPKMAVELLAPAHGLVLAGGGDVDPELYGGYGGDGLHVKPGRDRFEMALLAEAQRRGLPILGICRGAQLLNVSRGGTLGSLREDSERAQRHRNRRGHSVRIAPDSLLARIFGATRLEHVTTLHGQYVERPGSGLTKVAWAEDGTTEAIEAPAHAPTPWLVGVQWHPELARRDIFQRRLFAAFVDAVREHIKAKEEERGASGLAGAPAADAGE